LSALAAAPSLTPTSLGLIRAIVASHGTPTHHTAAILAERRRAQKRLEARAKQIAIWYAAHPKMKSTARGGTHSTGASDPHAEQGQCGQRGIE